MWHPLRHPELLVCTLRDHVFGDEFAHPTADGRHLAQCLRCRCWVVIAEKPAKVSEPPRRGKALRQAIILRLIAVDRGVHAVLFGAVAVAAIALDRNVNGLHSWANSLLDALNSARHGSGGASSHGLIAALLTRLAHVKPHSLTVLALFATIYAVVEGTEAVGLWMERRWAEYLTVVATAGFLPLEIHELTKRVTFVRLLALVVNLAILVYLVWAKHLFGIGRGEPPEELEPIEPLPALVNADVRARTDDPSGPSDRE